MELQLGLALCGNSTKGYNLDDFKIIDVQDENNVQVLQTLPLLVWDKVDDDNDQNNEPQRKDGGEDGVVGWPPINSLRKKLCHQSRRGVINYVTVENGGVHGGSSGGRGSIYKYVKVKMEGVGIARKIDLSLFQSYKTLTDTLISMFGKSKENGDVYKLTYQDKEGDWLLAGDVPWRTFVGSVQRLKLIRDEDY
ncbi:auxin-responsive protein IAA20-like [Solanum dulcamara]|uniref:auxin-responsive protein IAA20-like n=1 Tax=Solanum dulcamara TaxID=45834 RepID=UPI0024868294|nr:auxin-responsive protein IAA20-like [Solanum dulcamara]